MGFSNKIFPPRPTALAHEFAAGFIGRGDLVIDATCGNGHDTLQLARLVGPHGKVLAFDIQPAALAETACRLKSEGLDDGRVQLIEGCHTTMAEHAAPAGAALVVFNLGYLPGGDHALTTAAGTTVVALDAAVRVLRSGGLLMVTCYPGHPEGAREAEVVRGWMRAASERGARVAAYSQPFTQKPAPILWLAGSISGAST